MAAFIAAGACRSITFSTRLPTPMPSRLRVEVLTPTPIAIAASPDPYAALKVLLEDDFSEKASYLGTNFDHFTQTIILNGKYSAMVETGRGMAFGSTLGNISQPTAHQIGDP